MITFATQSSNNGVLVQLVRMPACHAGGHGFESRTYRKKPLIVYQQTVSGFLFLIFIRIRPKI